MAVSTDPEPAVPSDDGAVTAALGADETSAGRAPGDSGGGAAADPTARPAGSDTDADGARGATDTPPVEGITDGALADRVRAVEDLPLADRADAFSALHDELRTRLETGGAGA